MTKQEQVLEVITVAIENLMMLGADYDNAAALLVMNSFCRIESDDKKLELAQFIRESEQSILNPDAETIQ